MAKPSAQPLNSHSSLASPCCSPERQVPKFAASYPKADRFRLRHNPQGYNLSPRLKSGGESFTGCIDHRVYRSDNSDNNAVNQRVRACAKLCPSGRHARQVAMNEKMQRKRGESHAHSCVFFRYATVPLIWCACHTRSKTTFWLFALSAEVSSL